MRKLFLVASLVVLGACAETTDPQTSFSATMRGASVVPPVTTNATGTATLTVSGSTVNYTVTVSGLSGPATMARLYVGAAGAAGTQRVNLCGTGAPVPACGTATTGTLVNGTVAAANLLGITVDELLVQIRNFNAYVSVHTAANVANGEIRGQLVGT